MAIYTKLSDSSYPGFSELRKYIESCGIPDYWSGESKVNKNDDHAWFENSGRQHYGGYMMGNISDNDSEMTNVINTPEFRFFHNLLPAGTDVVTAFCQLMAIKYEKKLGLAGLRGTYKVKFNVWTKVVTHKNEAQLNQEITFYYSIDTNSKADFHAIICL